MKKKVLLMVLLAVVIGVGCSKKSVGTSDAGLRTIHFDFDKYDIRSDAREVMAQNAEYLKTNSSVEIQIEGHCDERGSTEYNMALGQRRANAAKQYLVDLGVDGSRVTTISYGEERPVDSDSTPSAWSKNRRAEFRVTSK
ncbi:MAG: peptidoglycan-associated lipoprotein Pal [Deltaproteobacteria bacterium]|nr:peptidoglycan-associated lipoprotein Pal [Deltaproteobacteria bacterium]